MNITDAIQTRRSIKIFKDSAPISKESVEQLLQAAVMAPNHHHTEPWKFLYSRVTGACPCQECWQSGRKPE